MGSIPELTGEEWEELKAGDVVIRETGVDKKGAREYLTVTLVDGSPAQCSGFIRRYDLYRDYMPNVKSAEASWNGNLATVKYHLKVALSNIRYKLRVLHLAPGYIEWEYIEGDIKDTYGSWKFFPYGAGKTLAVYRVFTDPGMPIPQFILNILTKGSLPDVLRAVKKGVREKMQGSGGPR